MKKEKQLAITFKKSALLTLLLAVTLISVPLCLAEQWHEDEGNPDYGIVYIIPIDVQPWTPPLIELPELPIIHFITDFDYFLWTEHGGWWYDAEKTLDNTDDNDMCWAASCSNAQEWTGWGIVNDPVNGLLEDSDEILQNYNYYWMDSGGFMSRGWDWWFDGTTHSKLEIEPSGNYFASETYGTYYDEEWTQSVTIPRIDEILHRGDSVTLGIRPVGGAGGHAITCWGFRYDSLKDKDTETDEYYIGVWVTDSDDNKGSNTADPPPNTLRYYELEYDSTNNRWEMTNYGGGWYIEAVMALAPKPGETRPIADAGSNIVVSEGTSASFSGSGSTDDDALQYRWDFDEDYLWDTAWSSSFLASHTWPDNLAEPVKISLDVYDGTLKDVAQIYVTIQNVAPTIGTLTDDSVNEGASFTKSGSFTDPGADSWTATVDYGDGNGPQSLSLSGKTFTLSHTYKENGLYTVTVTVTDDDSGTATETLQVTVYNIAPVLGSLSIANINENGVATLSGTITDPGVLDTYTLTIDWGEGSPQPYIYAAGTTSFTETHQYLDDNPTATPSDSITVVLTVTDDDGGSDTDSTSLTVSNLAPTVEAGTGQTANEGDTVIFSGSYLDTGTLDTHILSWDFGDLSSPVTGTTSPTHVYADEGTYTVTFAVIDDDTGTSSDTLTVQVYNVAPTITSLETDQPNPQFILPDVHTIQFTATFTDPGWLDTHTANWDYGDSVSQPGVVVEENTYPDSTGTVTGSHTYTSPGSYTVTLTVTDNDDASTTETIEIYIVTVEEAVQDTCDYIQGLDDSAFSKTAANQKKTLENMFQAIQAKLDNMEYNAAINQLEVIRALMDGEGKDWIVDSDAQIHLMMKIDDITNYLTLLL